MGALAARLSAPKVVRCKFGQIIDSLDDADRSAIAEYETGWTTRTRRTGTRTGYGAERLSEHLAAVKIHVGKSVIARHFDHDCQCTRSD